MHERPPAPGEIEVELGVPIPGVIRPPEEWARTAIKKLPPPGPLDWTAVFGRSAPRLLDLGCGNGRFLVSSAVRRPDVDHLGLDILPLVIRYATRRANQRALHNARLAVCGAYEFLEQYVAPHSIDEIHLYHPQPYRDVDRAYRRLVTPEFLTLVVRSLVPAGLFVLQTDNLAYWQYVLRIAPEFFEFEARTDPWPEDPLGRTRREIVARSQGLPIFRGLGRPRADRTLADLERLAAELPRPQFDAAPDSERSAGRSSAPRSRRSRGRGGRRRGGGGNGGGARGGKGGKGGGRR